MNSIFESIESALAIANHNTELKIVPMPIAIAASDPLACTTSEIMITPPIITRRPMMLQKTAAIGYLGSFI